MKFIKGYNNYIFERDLDHFLNSLYIINEKNETFHILADKMVNFLSKIKDNKNKIIKFLDKMIKFLEKISMKKGKRILLYLLISIMSMTSLTSFNLRREYSDNMNMIELIDIAEKIKDENKSKDINIDDIVIPKIYKGDLDNFMHSIAQKESSGNWKAINNLGYMGLYQFGKIALKDIGLDYNKITPDNFRRNPNIFPPQLQNKAMKKLISNNLHYLRNYMDEIGNEYKGVKITKSGLIAAAHLVGAKQVKKFLRSKGKIDPVDGNGTSVSDYMLKFGGYNLSDIGK